VPRSLRHAVEGSLPAFNLSHPLDKFLRLLVSFTRQTIIAC
jgi:hypothetical protein